ncbi:L-threonylcarbamoyladenylate synthase [Peloplasma aerotolerans]|uniref:Threonylcarbamoyl-AMP synthase n=1 Tax=Peloplasma aerotolerans TaxID=3044389 RepID=A0AAW6U7V9_9MOLU|nr:L-threonylcarbamoyladenylate synthase [Mariniplasma sp. M4Ah]MDI6453025.1 L-threonylcarbamoyladenylate synthase [Mariniplasma sp. M4Ah]
MQTTIYQKQDLKKSKVKKHIETVFHQGGLVVFPTETVYGIGANATNKDAVNRIFQAKGRPSDNPLIVHLSHRNDLTEYVKNIPDIAYTLIDQFWPGPLTLIFEKNEKIPYEVTGGLDTVAIRIPDHGVALDVIHISKCPVCAPSANVSGKPSSTLFEHVVQDFDGKVDIIINGGKTKIGLESTVLDITLPIPTILRPGSITQKMIEIALNTGIIDGSEVDISDIPKSPGMKYTHYKPKGSIYLVDGKMDQVIEYINSKIELTDESKSAVICVDEYMSQIQARYKINLGHMHDLNEIASNIFIALRQMDALDIETIYIPTLPVDDIGRAIMNRLSKAASYQIIKL